MLKLWQHNGLYYLPVRVGTPEGYATWTAEEYARLIYFQTGPMICVVEMKQWVVLELSSSRNSKPYLKLAARGLDVLHVDLDDLVMNPVPMYFVEEIKRQLQVGRYVLHLPTDAQRICALGGNSRLDDLVPAVVQD